MATKPKFQTVEDKWHWRPDVEGEPVEYVIPLTFKTGFYRRLNSEQDFVLQFAMVLTEVDQPKTLETFDDLDLTEGAKTAETYFEAFRTHLGATAGK